MSIKFEFEPGPAAEMMAADQPVRGVPPSLSAKVVGYVDSRFNLFVAMSDNVCDHTAAPERLHDADTVVFRPAVA